MQQKQKEKEQKKAQKKNERVPYSQQDQLWAIPPIEIPIWMKLKYM